MDISRLLYEDTSGYHFWRKVIIDSVPAMTIPAGLLPIFRDKVGTPAMFAATLFDALLCNAVRPGRREILRGGLEYFQT
jgi:hypothetical protein